MEIKIAKSPYGDAGTTYTGMLGMTNFFKLQLISFRSQEKTDAERQHLEADISGYDEILQRNNEDDACAFYILKQHADSDFENNMEVIKELKRTGAWK